MVKYLLIATYYFFPLIAFIFLPLFFLPFAIFIYPPEFIKIFLFVLIMQAPSLLVILIAAKFFNPAAKFSKKFLVLYIGWVLAILPFAYVGTVMMSGVSMAVVEGVVDRNELFKDQVFFTLKLTIYAHLMFIPWIILTLLGQNYLERKKTKNIANK